LRAVLYELNTTDDQAKQTYHALPGEVRPHLVETEQQLPSWMLVAIAESGKAHRHC
jgi:hypothetical protein